MTAYPGKLAGAAFLADPGVKRIFALLGEAGHEARVVGGAVRNALMGLAPTDIDFCTTALPEETIRRATAAGIHAVPTGFEHGTVTLVVMGKPYEVTTLREDIETDGRRAKVKFGRSFRKDALRRDFTMNALSCDVDGTVHDYSTGLRDVAARRVRFIGDPERRIREDYLRILRLFRFSAAYGDGSIDARGLSAAARLKRGLGKVSRERIGQETMKLLVQPHAAPVVAAMDEHGFWKSVLGGRADVARFARLCAIEAALGEKPDAVRRLAALAVFRVGDAERLQERLRLSGAAAGRLFVLPVTVELKPELKILLYRLGPDVYRDAILAAWAKSKADAEDQAWREAYRLPERWTPPKFTISGKDLIAAGTKPGPELGEKLKQIEAEWITAGMPAERKEQTAIMRAQL